MNRAVRRCRSRGFTLIELMIAVVVIGLLAAIALPSYRSYVTRGSREAAQAELVEYAGTEEKIFLNSNAYTAALTTAYNGTSAGGLGVTTGKTRDGRYTLSAAVTGASYTLTATPIAGTSQASDGNLTIASDGTRTWGSKTW